MWNLKISIMMITTEFPLFFEFLSYLCTKTGRGVTQTNE